MSTRAVASAVISLPIDRVWHVLRDFCAIKKLVHGIISCELEDGKPQTVGVVRTMKWEGGEIRRHRLIEHSDIFHKITWELIESDPPTETLGQISRVHCIRVTETNSTYVEWSGEFSSGTPIDFVLFEQRAYHRNLADIRLSLTKIPLPVLYHVHEGPSTRVAWVAAHLGIPIRVKIVTPKLDGSHSELSTEKGGVVTRFTDGDLLLLESGSTVMHLIEKHDICHNLNPFKKGSAERAKYLQWFFYSSSTVDHLLFEAYKQLFVVPEEQQNTTLLEELRVQWDSQIILELENAVVNSTYICGKLFTGADIMVGWSLYFAHSIGWLEGHPILESYLTRLRGISSFNKAFSLIDSSPFYFEH
jgi:glutathione S-transferase